MSKYVPFLVCLLNVFLWTSEHDTIHSHAYNSNEIFLLILMLLLKNQKEISFISFETYAFQKCSS